MIGAAIDKFDQNEDTYWTAKPRRMSWWQCYTKGVRLLQLMVASLVYSRIKALGLNVTEYSEEAILKHASPTRWQNLHQSEILPLSILMKEWQPRRRNGRDVVWELASFIDRDNEKRTISGWSAVKAITALEKTPLTTIRYLQFLNAPPTELSTIYIGLHNPTELLKLVDVGEEHGLSHIVGTADLAIRYTWRLSRSCGTNQKPWSAKWQCGWEETHDLMTFIASLGKLFGDGGLLQVMTTTGLYADATAWLMLQGKQLARSVRGLRLVLQAGSHVRMKSAQQWAEEEGLLWVDDVTEQGLRDLQTTFSSKDRDSCLAVLDSLKTSHVDDTMKRFQAVSTAQSSTFRFWDDFMEGAHIMLRLLRAERDVNFDLHLQAVSERIPYFIVGGRHSYARYTAVYIANMKQLEQDHPDVYRYLCTGGSIVCRTQRLFKCMPMHWPGKGTNSQSRSQEPRRSDWVHHKERRPPAMADNQTYYSFIFRSHQDDVPVRVWWQI